MNQLSKKPTDKSTVLVSFAASEKKGLIKELAKNHNVQVERMYHVYKTDTDVYRGGYLKDPSETLDEALAQHEREILEGIEMQVRDLTQQISEEPEFVPTNEKDNGKSNFAKE